MQILGLQICTLNTCISNPFGSNYQCATKQNQKSIDWSDVSVLMKSKHFNVEKIGDTFYAG